MKKISEAEARERVLRHVEQLDGKRYTYELAELRRSDFERRWIALFDLRSADGGVLDGPVGFLIDADGVHDGPMAL